MTYRPELSQGPSRAALALPNIPVADALARRWGEAVWTHPIDFKIVALGETPVTLGDVGFGLRLARLPDGCCCEPVSPTAILLKLECPLHGHLRGRQMA